MVSTFKCNSVSLASSKMEVSIGNSAFGVGDVRLGILKTYHTWSNFRPVSCSSLHNPLSTVISYRILITNCALRVDKT